MGRSDETSDQIRGGQTGLHLQGKWHWETEVLQRNSSPPSNGEFPPVPELPVTSSLDDRHSTVLGSPRSGILVSFSVFLHWIGGSGSLLPGQHRIDRQTLEGGVFVPSMEI
jgi:hypothetical protein